MHLVVVVGELGRDHRLDDVFDQVGTNHRVAVDPVVVLGRHEHGGEPDGLVALVFEGDLGLGVGPQVRDPARLAYLGMALGPIGLEQRRIVIVEAEPIEAFDDLVNRILRRALAVGILDPEQRLAAVMAREQQVEQRGAT